MRITIVWKNFIFFVILFISGAIKSCSEEEEINYYKLENLPDDTGGVHLRHYLGDTDAPYGYHIYLPAFYDTENIVFPLLVYYHGKGNDGNSMDDPGILDSVLRHGPHYLIVREKSWDPPYPMIVVSPQYHDNDWSTTKIKRLLDYLVDTYKVNEERIYFTGISLGAVAVWRYIAVYGDTSRIAAIVPICGSANGQPASQFLNTPVWAFHGAEDDVIEAISSISMVEAIKSESGGQSKSYNISECGS